MVLAEDEGTRGENRCSRAQVCWIGVASCLVLVHSRNRRLDPVRVKLKQLLLLFFFFINRNQLRFKSGSTDSERIDSAQFFRNSDTRDASRITVSTLPLTTKYPKLPEPHNPPSVLIGEIHSEDTPQYEPWATGLRPRSPPTPSLENGSKRRAKASSKTFKPTRRYRKNL